MYTENSGKSNTFLGRIKNVHKQKKHANEHIFNSRCNCIWMHECIMAPLIVGFKRVHMPRWTKSSAQNSANFNQSYWYLLWSLVKPFDTQYSIFMRIFAIRYLTKQTNLNQTQSQNNTLQSLHSIFVRHSRPASCALCIVHTENNPFIFTGLL